mmetsp:Transcript_16841/g.44512  ORF Transcript_16841/g.44512 Transcript_16841/m.44512 type:complete len:200 (+) Transcript_16841:1168-1767(+)
MRVGRVEERGGLHVLQLRDGVLQGDAAVLRRHQPEGQRVEPLPMKVLGGDEAVPHRHRGPADPIRIVGVPIGIVVGHVAANLVALLPRAQPFLLALHERLLDLPSHDAREEVHRRRARAEVVRVVLDEVEAPQLLVQRGDAAQLLQQHPAHLPEAGGVAEHRDPGGELVLERGRALGACEEHDRQPIRRVAPPWCSACC